MSTTMPGRMLRLLSLLQSRREWPGPELAQRLGVSDRTIRRDIGRLRELGYPVDGATGTTGGYRLASGRNLPPLLLDDDEAVAIAVGLRTAANASVAGIEETAVRALAKLEPMLPPRLRERVGAVGAATVPVSYRGAPPVDPSVLASVAAACRDQEILVFDYRGRDGAAGSRRVEPHSVVTASGRWYLVAYDLRRDGWRTFRLDRLAEPEPVRHRFTPRSLPAADAAAYLRSVLVEAPYRYRALATVQAPAAEVMAALPLLLPGKVQPLDEATCLVRLGADSLGQLAADLVGLSENYTEYTLDAPPELVAQLGELALRLLRATGAGRGVTGTSGARPPARR